MEFSMSRGSQPAPQRVASNGASAPSNGGGAKAAKSVSWKSSPAWLRAAWVLLLFAITALIVSIVFLLYFGGPKESNFVDKSKEQAVFLTNGQVYFGKIKEVNRQFINLQGIYYLNVNQQVQPDQKSSNTQQQAQNSISLVKLGCELHGPVDQMVINRDQVTFWENLKTDGQVTKAVDQWVKQNPQGQQCNQSTGNTTTPTTNSKP
jgi:hypothetical protein